MKFLFDLFPIILFFIAFKLGDIYTATIVAMIATEFSEEAWVNFKLFGSTGLLIVFVIAQGIWLGRHMEQPSA